MKNILPTLHGWILNLITPFLKWSSGKHLPFTHKLITGLDYYQIEYLLQPGDIFLTRIRGELTTLIIPGFFSHAAIYCPEGAGDVNEFVMEAEGPGVVRTDLVSFLLSKDYVVIRRPRLTEDQRILAAQYATAQRGLPYDYNFKFSMSGQKAFYCSELVWWSYAQACALAKVECPFVPVDQLGVATITPDDIYTSNNFNTIYDSRNYSIIKAIKTLL